jgi:hypothetical protein
MTCDEVAALRWAWDPRSPLLGPPFPSPVLADPTFLPPDATPDGRWHLWAHSLLGIHHHTSDDGFTWRRVGTVARNALRAQVVDLGEAAGLGPRYRLLYERTRVFLPFGLPWRSWIESRASHDLWHWSDPVVLLRPSLPWHRDARHGEALSNPCLVPLPEGGWRLYVSAGFAFVPDCGFTEPAWVGVAEGPTADGPFRLRPEPLLGPDPGDPWGNLGAGAVEVRQVRDGWVAFQNAIGWDGARSSSAIRVLASDDGVVWHVTGEPILAPTGRGWAATHVYALDVRDTPSGIRLYANGRSAAHWTRGREHVGLATPVTG